MATPQLQRRLWLRRLAWLLAFWVAGVVALALVAGLLRQFMNWAGLTA